MIRCGVASEGASLSRQAVPAAIPGAPLSRRPATSSIPTSSAARQRPRPTRIGLPTRSGDRDAAIRVSNRNPARRLLGVVARLTQALSVGNACRGAVPEGNDMVGVADRGLTPRHSAELVSSHQQAAESLGEAPPMRLHRNKLTGVRPAVEPAQPPPRLTALRLAGSRIGPFAVHPRSGCRRRDRAETGDDSRLCVAVEQRDISHHQLDLDRNVVRLTLAGHSPDQLVGHHLAAGSWVSGRPGAVGGQAQSGVRSHALLNREQGGQLAHHVRRWAQAHPPIGGSRCGSARRGMGIEPVRTAPGFCLRTTIAEVR